MRPSVFIPIVLLAVSSGATGFARLSAQQAGQPAGDQAGATFKSEIGIVEIDAVVTDGDGHFVRNLTRDDFQVYEDGRARTFSLFSLVDVPVPSVPLTAPAPAPESDVRTLAETQGGRVYVLVLDDLHTAPLRTQLLKAAARRFIERYFYPGDMAAIVFTGPGQAGGQELTGSRRLLLAAIDRFHGQQIDSAASGRLETFRTQQARSPDQPDQGTPLDDPNDAERSFNARRTLSTLRDAAGWMSDIQGRRKSLIFFSEGIDYDITDVFSAPGATGVQQDARDSIGSAARANVSIYSVDPRGLSGLSDDFIELAEPQIDTRTQREQLGTKGIEHDLRIAQDNLRMLAEQTGGLSIVNSNDFSGGFERIVRDNSSYYVLGYYTQPDAKGGKFHKIDVKVRRPGLQVRARRGYVAPDPRAKASRSRLGSGVLNDALASPIPAGNLPMRVLAASFKADGKNASVLIAAEIEGGSLKFQERAATFVDGLDFSLIAVGLSGKIEETDHGNVTLSVKPDIRERISRTGVRFLSRIPLPPGRYQLRVAARETGGGAAGVVHYDLDVPDFNKEPLSMSGLLLTTPSAGLMATSRGDAQLQKILPTPPTTARTFTAGDALLAYAEIYDNVFQVAHGLDITSTVVSSGGRSMVSNHRDQAIPASTTAQTVPYQIEVPFTGLPAGDYVLRVEVRSRLSNGPSASREVPFVIR